MGYRSDVGALFYVRSSMDNNDEQIKNAKAVFDMWMQANMENDPEFFKGAFERSDGELKFYAESIKWYDGYEEVDWFNNFYEKFREELCENAQLDGGSGLHTCFAWEFVRIGEDLDDTVRECSEYSDYRLNINRSMSFD